MCVSISVNKVGRQRSKKLRKPPNSTTNTVATVYAGSMLPRRHCPVVELTISKVFLISVNTLGIPTWDADVPILTLLITAVVVFFTETTQFQPTYTVSTLHVATTTVPSGCRVNWAINILVTFPQLLY